MNNVKRYKKIIEWKRLEISSWKLELSRQHFKNRNSKDLIETEKIKKWQEYTEELYKKCLNDSDNHNGGQSPRAGHPRVWSQLGLMKHYCEQSYWRWLNSSWAISNAKRQSCSSAAFNTSANLENSAVATGLEKVTFHSNPKERQCKRMFKLLNNCAHFTC